MDQDIGNSQLEVVLFSLTSPDLSVKFVSGNNGIKGITLTCKVNMTIQESSNIFHLSARFFQLNKYITFIYSIPKQNLYICISFNILSSADPSTKHGLSFKSREVSLPEKQRYLRSLQYLFSLRDSEPTSQIGILRARSYSLPYFLVSISPNVKQLPTANAQENSTFCSCQTAEQVTYRSIQLLLLSHVTMPFFSK